MSEKPSGYHARRIRELARDYSAKGYQVVANPGMDGTPSFLARLGYYPDLIAIKGDERLVIEVTTSPQIAERRALNDAAEAIERHSGWELVLVLSNPRSKSELDEGGDIDSAWVASLLREASALANTCDATESRIAPLLVAWAGLEAAIRHNLEIQYRNAGWSGHSSLIREAATLGLVSRDDLDFLESAFRLRNRAAHGERVGPAQVVDVERLLRLAQQILAET